MTIAIIINRNYTIYAHLLSTSSWPASGHVEGWIAALRETAFMEEDDRISLYQVRSMLHLPQVLFTELGESLGYIPGEGQTHWQGCSEQEGVPFRLWKQTWGESVSVVCLAHLPHPTPTTQQSFLV